MPFARPVHGVWTLAVYCRTPLQVNAQFGRSADANSCFLVGNPIGLVLAQTTADSRRALTRTTAHPGKYAEGIMSASSGEKRRRRRARRFIEQHDTFSMRASMLAVVATGAFFVLQVARSFLPV